MNHTTQRSITNWLLIAAFFLVACQGGKEGNTNTLQAQIDSLEAANASQASQLKDMSDFMSIVSNGLDSIASQEEQLLGNGKGVEGKKMTKAELKANLDAFAALLERQRNRIAELEDSLQNKGGSYSNLRNIITFLNEQLDEKNRTIAILQANLNGKNVDIQRLSKQVKTLTASNEDLSNTVKQQGEALTIQSNIINECYIKIGTKKELQRAGILTGGGLLSKKKLDVTNFNNDIFQRVDIRTFTEVSLPSKNAKILTQMPSDSYQIVTNGNTSILKVTNPTAFWSVSNYLVIQLK